MMMPVLRLVRGGRHHAQHLRAAGAQEAPDEHGRKRQEQDVEHSRVAPLYGSLQHLRIWLTMSAAIELRRPKEDRTLLVLLAKDPVFTVIGVLCSVVGVILAVWPWESIAEALRRVMP